MNKICTNCGYEYPNSHFYKWSLDRYKGGFIECKECAKVRSSESRLKSRYNLTSDDIQSMMVEQEGRCEICNEEFIKAPCVDHNHTTGKVRGLLCHSCNAAIGLLNEDVEILLNSIGYLKKYQEGEE